MAVAGSGVAPQHVRLYSRSTSFIPVPLVTGLAKSSIVMCSSHIAVCVRVRISVLCVCVCVHPCVERQCKDSRYQSATVHSRRLGQLLLANHDAHGRAAHCIWNKFILSERHTQDVRDVRVSLAATSTGVAMLLRPAHPSPPA